VASRPGFIGDHPTRLLFSCTAFSGMTSRWMNTPARGQRVWVIDDRPQDSAAACQALAGEFDCEVLAGGELLLGRLAAGDAPDALVIAWELPGLSGAELCRRVRVTHDEITLPVVLVAARHESADLVAGLEAGACDYLGKDLVPAELRARLRALTRMQQRHRRSLRAEAELATTLRSIGDAVISTDERGRVTFLNPVAEQLTGWGQSEARGQPLARVFRILNESTRAPVESPVDRVLEEGAVVGLANHTLLVRQDGSEVPIDDSAAPIRDGVGRLTGVVLVFRDISEKKRAEAEREALLTGTQAAARALQHSEERLRRVVDASGAGLWDLDPVTGVLEADRRKVELMGLAGGSSFSLAAGLDALHADDRERVATALAAALAGANEGHYFLQFRTGGRGSIPLRWVESRATVLFDGSGRAVRLSGATVDITARKQAELGREGLLEALAAQPFLRVCVYKGPDLVYEMANSAHLEQVARGRVVLGKPLLEALPELKGQGFDRMLQEVMATGVPHVSRESFALFDRGDGVLEKRYFSFVCQPVRGASGGFDSVLAVSHDVTDGVRARQELQASQKRLQEIFERAPAAICLLQGPEHRFVLANPRYRRLVGGRDLVGKTVAEAIPEVIEQGFVGLLDEVRRSGTPYLGTETWLRLQRSDATTAEDVCLNFVYEPVRDAEGKVDSIFVHAIEVTELVRARENAERLARERQAAYDVLEHGDPAVILDADWRFTFANAAWEAIARVAPGEVLGKSHWEVFPGTLDPKLQYFEQYHRAMRERVPVHLTEYYQPLDLWTALGVYPTLDGGVAIFLRDVTQEKRAEAEAQSRAGFEQHLIGIVSHDLRNPLNAILLGTHLLLEREGLDERTLKVLLRIQSSAKRCTRLVGDLLDFTQARLGGGIPVNAAAGDLHTVVRQVVEDVITTSPERRVRVSTAGDGHGVWDLERLAQVVLNLVSNALKYSPPASVVDVRSEGDGDGVIVSVHNTGTPIAPEALARIFHPMQRATSHLENAARSVGLGLFIVKHMVEAHGGQVSVSSSAEEGTTFSFRVPRRPPSTPPAS
jgi:PAS domain S-box-containing protein